MRLVSQREPNASAALPTAQRAKRLALVVGLHNQPIFAQNTRASTRTLGANRSTSRTLAADKTPAPARARRSRQ